MHYRREIDGLRAFAVLSVILFHAGFTWISGGFLGVDVFFVISGYLITTIILKELDEGRFSIAEFYERRARRILPALFLVLACCMPIAYLLLMPDQLVGFARSLASVMAFLSNVYFSEEVNYFARSSEEEPLLHTWSLAVEEQYYAMFPLLLMLLRERGRRGLFIVVSLIALGSLWYADRHSLLRPDKAFFDTRGRAWELFAGSLVAIYILRWRKGDPGQGIAEIGSALGLCLIAWACLQFDQSMPFPGRYAIAPILGAVLVILFAAPTTWVGRILGCKLAVWIGLISYSAYLWHQPVFAFARVISQTRLTPLSLAALSVLSLLLAYLSWRFVEQPFRERRRFDHRRIFSLSITGGAILLALALPGHLYNGLPSRFSPADSDLIVSYEDRSNYVRARHQSYRDAGGFDSRDGFKLLIVGDSYSQDLVNILHEGQLFPKTQIRVRYIHARCQLYQGEEPISLFIEPRSVVFCSKDYYRGLKEMVQQADAVLVAGSWREWSAERLPATLQRLGIASKDNYIVFGRKSFGHINRSAYVGLSASEKSSYLNPITDTSRKINSILARKMGDEHFVDIQALVCGQGAEKCPIFDENGALLSHDGAHLTQAGARYVGIRLATDATFSRVMAKAER